jgi:phosphopantothenoylcysteine decarboxylase / phosphopantothenate---cysteine ligase
MTKKILIGITGGIASYKIIDLIRLLKKANYQVKTLLTKDALKFVTPLTLRTISQDTVYMDDMQDNHYDISHISLSLWADAFLIAPITANTIAKIANGIADNLLTSTVLSLPDTIPFIIAPAMNSRMWEKKITQDNILKVKDNYSNLTIIEPEVGSLACGETGVGRMASVETIYESILSITKT